MSALIDKAQWLILFSVFPVFGLIALNETAIELELPLCEHFVAGNIEIKHIACAQGLAQVQVNSRVMT